MRPNSYSFMPKISQEALDKAADDFAKKQARIYTPTFSEVYLETIIKLLPSFIHLPPDEAAKAAINYAKALIKELER